MDWFPQLIAPLEPAIFFRDYWEKKPLFLPRDEPSRFSSIFALSTIDSVLWNLARPKPGLGPRVSLVVDGQMIPAIPVSGGDDDVALRPEVIMDRIAAGATLLIERIERSSEPLSALCHDLERSLGCVAGVNLYLTPEASQGFPMHFDLHDVFILQMSGAKEWRISDSPLTLPLPGMRVGRGRTEAASEVLVVRDGTVLYIPRGFLHEARTGPAHSVHLTVGIKAPTWADLFQEAAADLATRDARFRRSIPVGLGRSRDAQTMETKFNSLLLAFAEKADFSRALDRCVPKGPGLMPPIATVIGAATDGDVP